MRIVINEKKIKRNKIIGQFTTFLSLAILLAGLVLSFRINPENQSLTNTLLSYSALIIGFILSQIGIFFTNRFGRKPRIDEIITSNLEKLNNQYTFFVYSTPLPMLLVGPSSMWIPIPITATGKISYSKGKWRQQGGGFLLKLFGQSGLGNPELEDANLKKDIQKLLSNKNIDENLNLPINTILVLLLKTAEIGDVSEAKLPIIEVNKLRRLIRHSDRKAEKVLSDEEFNKLISKLSP